MLAAPSVLQAAAGDEGSGKKKKSKKDKREKQPEQRSSRPKRTRPTSAADEGGSPRHASGAPELPEDQYVETAEDQDFIDDAGLPHV